MGINKIEINITDAKNDDRNKGFVGKYQTEYDELIKQERNYNEKKENLSQEKENLKQKINLSETNIKKATESILKEYNHKKDDLVLKNSIQIKKLEKDIKTNIDKFEQELQNDLSNAGIITKIIRFFTGYENKKRKEFNLECKNILELNRLEFEKNMSSVESSKDNKLLELEKDTESIKSFITKSKQRIIDIDKELTFYLEELKKLLIKIKFIESGDKEKYNKIYNEIIGMLNLKIYPSIKRIEDIKEEVNKFQIKYQGQIPMLEDENINNMLKEYCKPNFSNSDLKDIFIISELESTKKLLSNIDGKSLDDQQRQAVVTNEDNNLVIAGAGSGKTLTISAKVKYLVDKLKVNPKDILLITFTKKAAEEMQERISTKLGIDVNVKTFHALGYSLLGIFEGKKPDIFSDIDKFTNDFANKIVINNEELRKNIFEYFSTYMNDYVDPLEFDCIGEFYRANKSNSLDTINFKIKKIKEQQMAEALGNDFKDIQQIINEVYAEKNLQKSFNKLNELDKKFEYKINNETNEENKKYLQEIYKNILDLKIELGEYLEIKDKAQKEHEQKAINAKIEKMQKNNLTLKWEKVKSIEELIIANYFFMNGIDYIYEADYQYNTASSKFRQYKPDFFLPKYNLYIEHFGIDENGRCPQYSKIEEIKYLEGIKWKRELHETNGTKMEETYSFEHKKGKLINKLNEIFKKHNIPLKPLSQKQLIEFIKVLNNDNEYKEFYKLLNTFLSLFKSSNLKMADIDKFLAMAEKIESEYTKEKHILFLKIFKEYYKEYTKVLQNENKIDFSDMINKATDYLEKNNTPEGYEFKYIIIDEFQDISVARYKLINKIKEKNNSTVMAVGDDWQSIYRFAGSEISIFTKFKEYFGETEQLKIEKTYRNSQQLIDIAGDFVMKNPDQIKKDLKSDKSLDKPVILVDYLPNVNTTDSERINDDEHQNSFVRRLMKILSSFDKKEKKTILLLGRNNFDISLLENSKFFRIEKEDDKIKIESDVYPNLEISFLSVHKSKGLEADEVIIINNRNNLTGFPNKMVSDSVLSYVLKEEEEYMYAEERRLFYVALTRTKNHTYLMVPPEYSNFIEELTLCENIERWACSGVEEKIYCPVCSTGYLVKRTNKTGKEFYSCSNYPQCNFSTGDIKAAKSKVRCPSCGSLMIKRKGAYGEFYGCSNYPTCKHTYNIDEFARLEEELNNKADD